MDWSEIWKNTPAIVSVAKDIVLAGVAISSAIVGWKALTKWREETVGKRRLELAEDTLSAFYQMQETINDARAPMVWAGEMVPEDGIPEDVTKNAAYGPIRRLHRAMDTIRDWRTKRHRFAAVFGSDKIKPWTEIEQVLNSMDAACNSLLAVRHNHEAERSDLRDHYDKMRQTLFRGFENDEVAPKIAAAVSDIEAICRPIIQAAVDVRVRA